VIDFPDIPVFAAVAHDPRFLTALGITALAGAVRGMSGFGSGLMYVPLMSAVYGPQIAAPTFVVMDLLTGLYFAWRVWRKANWPELLPLAATAIFFAQFGVMILQYANPAALRWVMTGAIFAIVFVLATGLRYRGKPTLPVTLGVGVIAGLMGGALQMSGPPVVVYWLGIARDPVTTRATFLWYFMFFSFGMIFIYVYRGMMTAEVLALSLMVAPMHFAALWVGTKMFGLASEKTYRRVAYGVAAGGAIISAPVFDGWLR
jgi:uncharacterized membrane protein YfcA